MDEPTSSKAGIARMARSAMLARDRVARRKVKWTQHWPLPVAFVLAVVFWIYLDKNLVEDPKDTGAYDIVKDVKSSAQLDSLANKALNLRIPNNYTIRQVRNAAGEEVRSVSFKFKGPNSALRGVDAGLVFLADIPEPPKLSGDEGPSPVKITYKEVRTTDQAANKFILSMDPAEIFVTLEASAEKNVPLRWDSLSVIYPDPRDDWERRFFSDSIDFDPKSVTVTGSEDLINGIKHRDRIFEMDCTDLSERPELLLPKRQERRSRITFTVQLIKRLRDAGVRMNHSNITATVEIKPESYKPGNALYVDVIEDWISKKHPDLTKAAFGLDKSKVKIEITSFDPELTAMLQEDAKSFVQNSIRCMVKIGEVEPETDVSAATFQQRLTPVFFMLENRKFQIGRHLDITAGPVQLKRK